MTTSFFANQPSDNLITGHFYKLTGTLQFLDYDAVAMTSSFKTSMALQHFGILGTTPGDVLLR